MVAGQEKVLKLQAEQHIAVAKASHICCFTEYVKAFGLCQIQTIVFVCVWAGAKCMK